MNAKQSKENNRIKRLTRKIDELKQQHARYERNNCIVGIQEASVRLDYYQQALTSHSKNSGMIHA